MGMTAIPVRAELLLSVQRALLGAVSPSLRGVTVGWQDNLIRLRFYFDGPISDEEYSAVQVVSTEVIADFQSPWEINEEILRLDPPTPLECLEAWAFLRRE